MTQDKQQSEFFNLFGLYVPDHRPLPTEQQLQQMVRPLNFCSTCGYVLCSCGNCHNSELCNESCLYDQSEGESDV